MTNFKNTKKAFFIPQNTIYLDGNSLGPLPLTAARRLNIVTEKEWGELLIRGWNEAGWMKFPTENGNRIAKIINAGVGNVVVGDTLTIKVFQALDAAIQISTKRTKGSRNIILSDIANFPSDLYIAKTLQERAGFKLKLVEPFNVEKSLSTDVAILLLSHVDYRTGQLHDMQKISRLAKNFEIVTVWDLAHSVGVVEINLLETPVDFAVGCTYKYLCGGPGAPAFIYVNPEIQEDVQPAIPGWLGHMKPFDFNENYIPGKGIERMRIGTPPVLQMAVLEEALKIWEKVNISDVRKKSIELTEYFISEMSDLAPKLRLASPKDALLRGSQVSFFSNNGYPIIQALISEGIIGDFREPNIIRFGFNPLFNTKSDIKKAAKNLSRIISSKAWKKTLFSIRRQVT